MPERQGEHAIPSGPVYPPLQLQLVMMLLPNKESVFGGQPVHVASETSPISVEYLPLAHSVHAWDPSTSLYVPATQAEH